ncbi:hypothetical protein EYF80_026936 [Liparis tanakae]|uniref:Uncharacterized protein n=1 Tax=Liparis tanakae TaxID=230148 RepID=A0A4Z2HB60_9TELE|nr:hypothetical protein EYF80_026936 [Liparis tanakae]
MKEEKPSEELRTCSPPSRGCEVSPERASPGGGALRPLDGGVGGAGAVLVQLVGLPVVLLADLCEVVHAQAAELLCDGALTL